MAFQFDLPTMSPLIILLIIVVVFVFLKIMKYALLIAIVAGIYLAWRLGLIPGIPA